MSRPRDARIARLAARLDQAAAAEIHERQRLRAIAVIGAAVRVALEGAGIDPARATRLREAELAEAALAALPDAPDLQQTDGDDDARGPEGDPDALDWFFAETQRRASRYATGCTLDLATAPLADLLAWCIARDALTLQQDGSENLVLIRCKFPDGSRESTPAASNLWSKTRGLDRPNPDGTTDARETCC
jgi:hypothetical protein